MGAHGHGLHGATLRWTASLTTTAPPTTTRRSSTKGYCEQSHARSCARYGSLAGQLECAAPTLSIGAMPMVIVIACELSRLEHDCKLQVLIFYHISESESQSLKAV